MAVKNTKRLIRTGQDIADDFHEDLMRHHCEAMSVSGLEESCFLLSRVANLLTSVCETISSKFLKNQTDIPSYNDRRTLVKMLSELLSSISEDIIQPAATFKKEGYAVTGIEELIQAYDRLALATSVLKKTCPEVNKEMLARTANNIARGEVKTVKEILHGDGRPG
jgi:hypothetical protein